MEKVKLLKEVRGINTYTNAIDVNFSELIVNTPTLAVPELDIFDLFRLYNQLFYTIPLTGEYSHTTLIEQSSQYLGTNVIDLEKQALIEEINTLKQQIIELSETYLTVDSITN
jgi:hypothetical protein